MNDRITAALNSVVKFTKFSDFSPKYYKDVIAAWCEVVVSQPDEGILYPAEVSEFSRRLAASGWSDWAALKPKEAERLQRLASACPNARIPVELFLEWSENPKIVMPTTATTAPSSTDGDVVQDAGPLLPSCFSPLAVQVHAIRNASSDHRISHLRSHNIVFVDNNHPAVSGDGVSVCIGTNQRCRDVVISDCVDTTVVILDSAVIASRSVRMFQCRRCTLVLEDVDVRRVHCEGVSECTILVMGDDILTEETSILWYNTGDDANRNNKVAIADMAPKDEKKSSSSSSSSSASSSSVCHFLRVLRVASPTDVEYLRRLRGHEDGAAKDFVSRCVTECGLAAHMSLEEIALQYDGQKAVIYFKPLVTTPIDFRGLQRVLYQGFRCRVWLQQTIFF
eukprot:PhM_4_TR1282/c2_g1_i2/m.7403